MTLHFEKEEFLNYVAHLVRMAAQVSGPAHLHQAMSFADGKIRIAIERAETRVQDVLLWDNHCCEVFSWKI